MEKIWNDITILLKQKLSPEEIFYYASYIHLVFVNIHPFTDGNGRAARLLEKWFLAEKLGDSIDDLQLEFQSKEMVEFDEELLPTNKLIPYHDFNSLKKIGSTFFDNCFKLSVVDCQPLCVLRNPNTGIEVEIYPDPSYPYLQIYTPPHRRNIAIENLSGTPDAFNNGMGLITLEPGESALFKTAYKIKIL